MSILEQETLSNEEKYEILAKKIRLSSRSRSAANWLLLIGILSLFNSIERFFLGGRLIFVVGLGVSRLIHQYTLESGSFGLMLSNGSDLVFLILFMFFFYFARKRQNWPFVIAIVVYGLDTLACLYLNEFYVLAFHCLGLVVIYNGLVANRHLEKLTQEHEALINYETSETSIEEFQSKGLAVYVVAWVVLAFVSYYFMNLLAKLYILSKGPYRLILRPPSAFWMVCALFIGCALAIIPLVVLFKDRYFEVIISPTRHPALRGIARYVYFVVGGLATVLMLLGFNWYTIFTGAEIKDHPLLSLTETSHKYSEIQGIYTVAGILAPNGNVTKKQHFVLVFSDGTTWSSIEHAEDANVQKLMNYISVQSGQSVLQVQFDSEANSISPTPSSIQ